MEGTIIWSVPTNWKIVIRKKNGIVEKRITECRNPLKEALIRKEGGLSH